MALIGELAAGKNALMFRFENNRFEEEDRSCIICDYIRKNVDARGKKVKLMIV